MTWKQRDAKLVSPAMAEGSQAYRTIWLRHSLNNLLQLKTKPILCQTSVLWMHQFRQKTIRGYCKYLIMVLVSLCRSPPILRGLISLKEGCCAFLWCYQAGGRLLCFCVLGSPSLLPSDIQHSLQGREDALGESRAPGADQWRSAEGLLGMAVTGEDIYLM